MSKRTTLRPNQNSDSQRYKVWSFVRSSTSPVSYSEVVAGLPNHKTGTIGSALSEFTERGAMTRIEGNPFRYKVTPEQVEYMLENSNNLDAVDTFILKVAREKAAAKLRQPDPEPPTCAEVNLAIREVLMVTLVPLDAEDLAEKTGILLKYVRSELSYMATKEPHSAPTRFKLKGEGRSKVTYHYMKSQNAWDVWAARL